MKSSIGFITVIAILALALVLAVVLVPSSSFAQVQSFDSRIAPPAQAAAPPAAPPPAPGTNVPPPPDLSRPTAPGASPAPGTPPAAGATPAPQAEPLTWSTKALQDALTSSANVRKKEPTAKKKTPTKKPKLTDDEVDELRLKIARGGKELKARQKLADHFEAQDEPSKVVDALRPAADSLDRKGLLSLAKAYRKLKDHTEEVRVLEILLAQKEKDHFVQYTLGEAYARLGKHEQAMNHIEEARKLNPKHRPSYDSLLREYKRVGQVDSALAILHDMSSTFGETAAILSELCLIYAHQAYLEKALETCKAAIAKDGSNADNHVYLGLAVRDKDGNAAAEKILKKAAEQFPASEFAQWVAGELAWEKKNYPQALKFYQKAVKNSPGSARAQIGLARAAFEEKSYDEALRAFVDACTLNRTFVSDFRRAASMLRRKDNSRLSEKYDDGLAKCGLK